jgi:hypothetical protein
MTNDLNRERKRVKSLESNAQSTRDERVLALQRKGREKRRRERERALTARQTSETRLRQTRKNEHKTKQEIKLENE